MAVKALIKRRIKEGKSKDVFALLHKFRSEAMQQTGYISGETLIGHDDPQTLLVISMWQDIENWLNWKKNKDRKTNESLMEQYLDGPTEYEVFVLGTPVTKR